MVSIVEKSINTRDKEYGGGDGGGNSGASNQTNPKWESTPEVFKSFKWLQSKLELNVEGGSLEIQFYSGSTKISTLSNIYITGDISQINVKFIKYVKDITGKYVGTILITYGSNYNSSNKSGTIYFKVSDVKLQDTKLNLTQPTEVKVDKVKLKNRKSYYNSLFIYTNTGYHEGEIYRFGIVYIRKDGSLTLVYDILGKNILGKSRGQMNFPRDENGKDINLSTLLDNSDNIYWLNGSSILTNTYSNTGYNVKGICQIKGAINKLTDVIGITFTFPDNFFDVLEKNYKGFFFVRQKRIPTMLALGYVTNICEDSYVPSINVPKGETTDTGFGKKYYLYESFASGAFKVQTKSTFPDTFYPVRLALEAKGTYNLVNNYRSRLFSLSDYTYLYLDKLLGYGPLSTFISKLEEDFNYNIIGDNNPLLMSFLHNEIDASGNLGKAEYYFGEIYQAHEKDNWGGLEVGVKGKKDLVMILRIYKKIQPTPTNFKTIYTEDSHDNLKDSAWKDTNAWKAVNNNKDKNSGFYYKATSSDKGRCLLYRPNNGNSDYYKREANVMIRADKSGDNYDGLHHGLMQYNNKNYWFWEINGLYYEDYCGVYAHENSTEKAFIELRDHIHFYIREHESATKIESSLINDFTTPTFDGKYGTLSDDDSLEKEKDTLAMHMYPMEIGAYGVYCPEFELDQPKYNALFTGQSFKVIPLTKHQYLEADPDKNIKKRWYTYNNIDLNQKEGNNCNVIAVTENTSLMSNQTKLDFVFTTGAGVSSELFTYKHYGKVLFSSKIGDATEISFKYAGGKCVAYVKDDKENADDPHYGRLILKAPFNIVRGAYGPYLGVSLSDKSEITYTDTSTNLADTIVLIMIPEYKLESMEDYFKLRALDNTAYYTISDKISLDRYYSFLNNPDLKLTTCYRGDCFINWYTHRVNRNFQDPTAPYNDTILDIRSFSNSFESCYNEEYRTFDLSKDAEAAKKFNIGDINAVELGSWVTFPVRSSINTALRSIDNSFTTEKLACGLGRTFYPRGSLDAGGNNKLPESTVFNKGYNKSGGDKEYFNLNNNIFVNTYYKNRIAYSNILQSGSISNGHRTFLSTHYRDYTDLFGEIVKLITISSGGNENLLAVCEHGILLIPVNERALAGQGGGGLVFINTSNVLPENPYVVSNLYGSQFAESVIKTPSGVYGVDESSKKIWFTDGQLLKVISDFKIQKFLNKYLKLSTECVGKSQIKTHYNASKNDVIFTLYNITPYYKDQEETEENDETPDNLWSLCWNENQAAGGGNGWITYYSWIPIISNNIGNTFISVNLLDYNKTTSSINYLWKHGYSDRVPTAEKLKPTYWYSQQHPFEFEFIVNKDPGNLKIFDNLLIMSNNVPPESFHYEIIGDCYEFSEDKLNGYIRQERSKQLLSEVLGSKISYNTTTTLSPVYPNKITIDLYGHQVNSIGKSTIFPMYYCRLDIKNLIYDNYKHANSVRSIGYDYDALSGTELIYYPDLEEVHLCNHVKAVDMSQGLLRGNMRYLEESWRILITPINLLLKNEYYITNNGDKIYGWREGIIPIVIPNIKVNDLTKTLLNSLDITTALPGYTIEDLMPNTKIIRYEQDGHMQSYTVQNTWDIAKRQEVKLRDKSMKVKVRYTGDKLATIMGINTLYTTSYA